MGVRLLPEKSYGGKIIFEICAGCVPVVPGTNLAFTFSRLTSPSGSSRLHLSLYHCTPLLPHHTEEYDPCIGHREVPTGKVTER